VGEQTGPGPPPPGRLGREVGHGIMETGGMQAGPVPGPGKLEGQMIWGTGVAITVAIKEARTTAIAANAFISTFRIQYPLGPACTK
jgi:hypothetical protein